MSPLFDYDNDLYLAKRIAEEREEYRKLMEKRGEKQLIEVKWKGKVIYPVKENL